MSLKPVIPEIVKIDVGALNDFFYSLEWNDSASKIHAQLLTKAKALITIRLNKQNIKLDETQTEVFALQLVNAAEHIRKLNDELYATFVGLGTAYTKYLSVDKS